MSWLAKQIYKLSEAGRQQARIARGLTDEYKEVYGTECDFKNPLNITIYNAIGGRIIKFQYNGNKKNNETTYIVGSDENFEEALTKCIALEALKHVE